MKVLAELNTLTIDFLTDEHATNVPGGAEKGDLHYGRTKVDIRIVGSVNKSGVNEISAVLAPIASKYFSEPPPGPPVPYISKTLDELRVAIECVVADACDLGLTYQEFLTNVVAECQQVWEEKRGEMNEPPPWNEAPANAQG